MNALKTLLWSVFVPGTLTTVFPFLILKNSEGYFFELSVFRFIGIIPILFGRTSKVIFFSFRFFGFLGLFLIFSGLRFIFCGPGTLLLSEKERPRRFTRRKFSLRRTRIDLPEIRCMSRAFRF